jgi:hypothetical protein
VRDRHGTIIQRGRERRRRGGTARARQLGDPVDHHLHIAPPRTPREFAERIEFRELRAIARIVQRAGPQGIAERDRDVVRREDVEHIVIPLVQRILLAVLHHPDGVQRAAARDDADHPPVHEREVLEQDSGVDGHPMNAKRMKSRERNQDRQLLDQLQRIQPQVGRAICPRTRQLEHQLPLRALGQPLQRHRHR